MTRFASLMHDVGKPRTRKFQGDGSVTFHHHDVVGAKLTRRRMKQLRFASDTTDAVCRLVELHLRFHGYGSGSGRTQRCVATCATPAPSSPVSTS